MKKEFEQLKKLQREVQEFSWRFDKLVEEKYGFSYSDTDCDKMIDTLDYGTDDISYKDFKYLMDNYKKNFEKNGEFGIVFIK
jgi:hypothetical protein